MRIRRAALIGFSVSYLAALVVALPSSSPAARPQEAPTAWIHPEATTASIERGLTAYAQRLTVFANAVNAYEDNVAAAAFRAAEARQQSATTSLAESTGTRSTPAPTTTAASSAEAPGAIWSCIIGHESGGDPTAVNSSSGASGLYQFETGTWQANGGGQYAPTAAQATPAEQTQIAEQTQAADGWSPWIGDGCTPLG